MSYAIPHFVRPVSFAGTTYTSYADLSTSAVPWAVTFTFAAGRTVGLLLILIVIGAQFYCGMSSVTANSRMIFAFSRDGAVPFSNYWHHVNKKRRVPVRSAWFGAVGAFILSSPYLIERRRLRRGGLDRGHRPLHRLPDARCSCGASTARAFVPGP